LEVVITGDEGERELAETVVRQMSKPALNLAGKTDLGSLAALISAARAVVCNDTGVSHLAAALRVPSVVLVTASDPRRWGPEDRRLHRVLRHRVTCSPCRHVVCPIDHRCSTGLSSDRVVSEMRRLLRAPRPAA